MQKLSKCLTSFALGALCVGVAWAQNSNSTLEQAIEIARASKSGELGLRTAVRTDSEVSSLPKSVRPAAALPKVWSIAGIDRDLTAEVVYEGKVYPLSLNKNQVRVGPWMLLRLSANSADFAYLPNGQRMTDKTKVIEAFPPASTSQMQGYFDAPVTLGAPVAGPGALGTRPPLPPELMRPAMQP